MPKSGDVESARFPTHAAPVAAPVALGIALGAGIGWLLMSPAGALLTACAGGILGWSFVKRVVWAWFRGALLGAGFLSLVGPGADWFLHGVPMDEKLHDAIVIGSLVGGLLGVRNARRSKGQRPPPEAGLTNPDDAGAPAPSKAAPGD